MTSERLVGGDDTRLTLLGPAGVDEPTLRAMVADLLGAPDVVLEVVKAEVAAYDIPSITTAGRYWVSGRATAGDVAREWRIFVKHVQSFTRSPFFAFVPPGMQQFAAESVPWRTEAAVYRSDLAARLPRGLTLPRALGVFDVDELSQAIWLAPVEPDDSPWDGARDVHAAHLLGRLAGSPSVRPLAGLSAQSWSTSRYVEGRLTYQVLPLLEDESAWPARTLAAFARERPRLLAAADRLADLAAELDALPRLPGHGDACPNNLLVTADGFTLIDFGFWGELPLGFDLGQLVVGDVQLGRRACADLAERDDACLRAYHSGLAAEGYDVPLEVLRRAHAVHLFVFSGISSFLAGPVVASEDLDQQVALTRFSLDLLDATAVS